MNRLISTVCMSAGGGLIGFTTENLGLSLLIFAVTFTGGIFLGMDLTKD